MKKKILTTVLFVLGVGNILLAQNKNWSIHLQQTVISQHKPAIKAPYQGENSLSDTAETQTSLTTTLYIARRLWSGAALYFNPELAGGGGLSQARGIAGFTNGECFRIGDPAPSVYVARLFMRQDFALGEERSSTNSKVVEGERHGSPLSREEDGLNSIQGDRPTNRLTLVAGKFSIADYFDNNSYAHDPRTQFMNWSLMSNGAWDYPANTRGYTWSFLVEYMRENWGMRYASSLVPTYANGPTLNWAWSGNQSNTFEIEHKTKVKGLEGKVRLLAFYTLTKMGNYDLASAMSQPDITATRIAGRNKYGIGLNIEQALSADAGVFFRASINDGKNETWAFTEIDQAISAGYVNNKPFGRENDAFGVAIAMNGISSQHRNYLNKGGYGFIIGDGKLPNYSTENILELFYSAKIRDWFTISPNYQFIANPAYNTDRGPVHAFALRVHAEF
ncbi:MAG: carbohydrate porin [Spirosomataceae bacterium]